MKERPIFIKHLQTANQITTAVAHEDNKPRRLWTGIIKVVLPAIGLSLMLWSLAVADDNLYSTGRMMEVDRCASAWLIKRHVNTQAQFLFFEDGQLITKGISFDTPDSKFCRTHNLATFEVLLKHFKIQDAKLAKLAKAIHEIEINFWAGTKDSLATDLNRQAVAIIRSTKYPEKCFEKCFELFDQVMEDL